MRYIIHDKGKVIDAYEVNSDEYSVTYPGYTTVSVAIDSELWKNVLDNPEKYVYDNGILLDKETIT